MLKEVIPKIYRKKSRRITTARKFLWERRWWIFRRNIEALFLEGRALFSLLMEGIKAQTETSKEKNQDK